MAAKKETPKTESKTSSAVRGPRRPRRGHPVGGEVRITGHASSRRQSTNVTWGVQDIKDFPFRYTARLGHDRRGRVLAIQRGFPADLIQHTAQSIGINKNALCGVLGIPTATLNRKEGKGEPLPQDTSERLDRLAEITALATHVLGTEANAKHWLSQPNAALGNDQPVQHIGTAIEGDEVKSLLYAIEYGGAV